MESYRRQRGLTFLEVMIAAALLAVVLMAAMSATATSQRAIGESTDQEISMNAARNVTEALLQAPWADGAGGLLSYMHAPGGTPFYVPIPGAAPGTNYGTIFVREPTASECPGYNRGGGPRWVLNSTPTVPVPPAGNAPTLLVLIVRVQFPLPSGPPIPGRAPTFIELRSVRSYL
jgi:prepilin-type N-terminal cleavage/methylation domain-containing protein